MVTTVTLRGTLMRFASATVAEAATYIVACVDEGNVVARNDEDMITAVSTLVPILKSREIGMVVREMESIERENAVEGTAADLVKALLELESKEEVVAYVNGTLCDRSKSWKRIRDLLVAAKAWLDCWRFTSYDAQVVIKDDMSGLQIFLEQFTGAQLDKRLDAAIGIATLLATSSSDTVEDDS